MKPVRTLRLHHEETLFNTTESCPDRQLGQQDKELGALSSVNWTLQRVRMTIVLPHHKENNGYGYELRYPRCNRLEPDVALSAECLVEFSASRETSEELKYSFQGERPTSTRSSFGSSETGGSHCRGLGGLWVATDQ